MRITYSCMATFIMAMFFASCGQLDGNMPVGTTGGGDSGYGSTDASSRRIDPRLVGRWTPYAHYEDDFYLTLNSDGSGIYEEWFFGGPVDSTSGTWTADGSRFTFDFEGFALKSGSYTASQSELTLTDGGRNYHYTRVR